MHPTPGSSDDRKFSLLTGMRRWSRHAWIIHAWMIFSLVVMPVGRVFGGFRVEKWWNDSDHWEYPPDGGTPYAVSAWAYTSYYDQDSNGVRDPWEYGTNVGGGDDPDN